MPASELHITADASQAIAEVRSLKAELVSLRAELDSVRARSPHVQILKEPLTYEAHLVRDTHTKSGFRAINTRERRSYVQDFALANMKGDLQAKARLDRHAQEMRKLAEAREQIFHPDVQYEFEERAVNWTNGTGGYFAPPLWIIEQFAHQPTPYRCLSKLAPSFELPEGAQSVNIPAWSAGGEVAPGQLDSVADSTPTTDTAISSPVVTIAGNYDVPMQMLEQSPQGAHLDWVAFSTMEARYDYQLELQLLNGQGVTNPQGAGNNQLLGIFNNPLIPAANQIQYTGPSEGGTASAATAMFSSLGLAIAKVGQNRLAPPENWLMTTSRMAWLGSSEDQQSRPLMIADKDGSGQFDLITIEVQLDDAIPRTLGTSGNEERIVCLRPSDWLILESDRRTNVHSLKQDTTSVRGRDNAALGDAMGDVLSGTLMVRLKMRRYAAALLRYPTSVAYLYGSGMATGNGF